MADEEREEKVSEKAEKPKTAGDNSTEEVVKMLKEIREIMIDGRERQVRYLWLLFPIMAFQLIQALLLAARLQ